MRIWSATAFTGPRSFVISHDSLHKRIQKIGHHGYRRQKFSLEMSSLEVEENSYQYRPENVGKCSNIISVCGITSTLSWILISLIVLSYHPDPKFANCSVRHNVLTMMQAFAFPLSVLVASYSALFDAFNKKNGDSSQVRLEEKMSWGVAISSTWLACSALYPALFAFGYDLIPTWLKIFAGLAYGSSALTAIYLRTVVMKKSRPTQSLTFKNTRKARKVKLLYRMCSFGFMWFTFLPICSPYPLATLPSILGKRLTRPAAAFTYLAFVASSCLADTHTALDDPIYRKMRRVISLGCALHISLIVMKVLGVDGGGILFKGNGLWEVYPAMVAVPFSTICSLVIHALFCIATVI